MKSVKHFHPDAIEEIEYLAAVQATKIKYEANIIGNSINDDILLSRL